MEQARLGEMRCFVTASCHSGCFIQSTHTMEGLGIYQYPDGTEYRGNFKSGHFHGYGRIKFPPPKSFLIFGYFENDDLLRIDEMFFIDGLRFKGDIDESENKLKLKTDSWKYLTSDDRRYTRERIYDLDAVTPFQRITNDIRIRDLPKESYDTEEGILKSSTGFIVDIQNEEFSRRFVNCQKEMEWLKKNCRKSSLNEFDEPRQSEIPTKEFRNQIMRTNVKSLLQFEDTDECTCNLDKDILAKFHFENVDAEISTSAESSLSSTEKQFKNVDKESNSTNIRLSSDDTVTSSPASEYLIEALNKRCKLELQKLRMRKIIQEMGLDSESDDECIRRRSVLN